MSIRSSMHSSMYPSMLSPRFFTLPVLALAVIAALAQAHGDKELVEAATIERAKVCTVPLTAGAACAHADVATTLVR